MSYEHIERAKQHNSRGEHDRAMEELHAALALDPRNDEAHLLLGIVHHHRADYDAALCAFERALELNPGNSRLFVLMGNVHNTRRCYGEAERLYRTAVERGAPNVDEAYRELGKLAEFREDYRAAAGEYERALAARYDTDLAQRLILIHKYLGDWERVESLVDGALGHVDPSDRYLTNIFLNEREIARGKTVIETRPRSLTISLTSRCNLDCVMCEAKRLSWDMPEKTLREVIECFPYLEHVMWQGGEVFLLDSFKDILREAKKYPRMKQVITSNGMALDDELIEILAEQPDLTLTLSVDGTTKELFERIRAGASFDRLIETIGKLNAARRRHGSRMKLNVNVTVMKSNHRHLMDFIEFAREHRFDFVFFTNITGNHHSEENIFVRQDREALDYLADTIAGVEEKAREYGIVLHNWLPVRPSLPKPQAAAPAGKDADEPGERCDAASPEAPAPAEEPKESPCPCGAPASENEYRGLLCYAPWQRFYIDWKGNFFPDCMCLPEQSAGNVLERSITELWNGEGMQRYRRKMLERDCDGLCKPDCISGRIPSQYLKFNR